MAEKTTLQKAIEERATQIADEVLRRKGNWTEEETECINQAASLLKRLGAIMEAKLEYEQLLKTWEASKRV